MENHVNTENKNDLDQLNTLITNQHTENIKTEIIKNKKFRNHKNTNKDNTQSELNDKKSKSNEDYKNYIDYTKDLKSEKFNFYYKVS